MEIFINIAIGIIILCFLVAFRIVGKIIKTIFKFFRLLFGRGEKEVSATQIETKNAQSRQTNVPPLPIKPTYDDLFIDCSYCGGQNKKSEIKCVYCGAPLHKKESVNKN